jgi:hypothetical protein
MTAGRSSLGRKLALSGAALTESVLLISLVAVLVIGAAEGTGLGGLAPSLNNTAAALEAAGGGTAGTLGPSDTQHGSPTPAPTPTSNPFMDQTGPAPATPLTPDLSDSTGGNQVSDIKSPTQALGLSEN